MTALPTLGSVSNNRATRDARPDPIDGRYKYFVELHGRRFPIKQVLRLITGLREFGAQDAHRILSRLGFDVSEYEAPAPVDAGTPPRANGNPASSPDPGAGNQDGDEVLRLLVVFERDEDGWEVASCPTLPGCHTQGRTRKEALANVREAIRGYLASLREHDGALPPSSEFQIPDPRRRFDTGRVSQARDWEMTVSATSPPHVLDITVGSSGD